MSVAVGNLPIGVTVSDVSGQKMKKVNKVPYDATIGELIQELSTQMNLPKNDVAGRPLKYQARLDREARHLQPFELVGEALQNGDSVMLQPNVDAGGGVLVYRHSLRTSAASRLCGKEPKP